MALFRSTPQIFTLYDTTLTQSASTSFVASATQITLPAGTYQYEGWVGSSTASGTAGCQTQLTPSMVGSGSFVIRSSRGSQYFALTTDQGATRRADTNAYLLGASNTGAAAQALVGWLNGTLILTSAQTFGFEVAQRQATDASNPTILSTGSYIKFTKIA
jgi:hypothetical protein